MRNSLKLSALSACSLLLVLPACSSGSASPEAKDSSPTATVKPTEKTTQAVPEPELVVSLKDGDPATKALTVRGYKGVLKAATVTAEGSTTAVAGALNGIYWEATGKLTPATTYNVKAEVLDEASKMQNLTATFTTKKASLDELTYASISPKPGSKVGIAQPIVVRFDLPVTAKKRFEKEMTVTATPAQEGSWHWMSDTEARWRPAAYWQPGTKVSVAANVKDVPAGGGRYGQYDKTSDFTVDSVARTVKVNLNTKMLKAYKDGKLVKTLPISAGKEPAYTTRSGVKVIMEKHRKYDMNSSSIGIDPNSSEGYDLSDVEYAMRITNSGEFFHAAPWNSSSFGRVNASHGCTGLSTANARWLYNFVSLGTPIEYKGTDRSTAVDNGYGDWNEAFADYKQGSALAS